MQAPPASEGCRSTLTSGSLLGAEVYSSPGPVGVLGLVVDDGGPEEHLQNTVRVGLAILHLSVLEVRSGLPAHITLVHQAVDTQSGEPLPLTFFGPYKGHRHLSAHFRGRRCHPCPLTSFAILAGRQAGRLELPM